MLLCQVIKDLNLIKYRLRFSIERFFESGKIVELYNKTVFLTITAIIFYFYTYI